MSDPTNSATPNRIREALHAAIAKIDAEYPWVQYIGKVKVHHTAYLPSGKLYVMDLDLFDGIQPTVFIGATEWLALSRALKLEPAVLAALIYHLGKTDQLPSLEAPRHAPDPL